MLLSMQRAFSTAPDALRTAYGYCVQQVRLHDDDNYSWVVQAPKELRPALMVLRAFNVETALVAERARSEPLVMMRYQWWRDAVNAAYKGSPPEQPVALALADVLSTRQLPRYRLQRIVSTREADLLRPGPPPDLAALEAYAEGTTSQLVLLQLEAAGLAGRDADHAASHLGKAVGLANLLRGTARHAARRRVYLPADLLQQHSLDEESVLSGQDSEGMRDVALAVASAAKAHLDEARALQPRLPSGAACLLLPGLACGLWLEALERQGFNLFHPSLPDAAFSPLTYQLRLKLALLRGTY